ncbi:MAG: radical SAM family heme chaperone HemW [Bacteroidetes bacterium]|nr:radical SAM family heme chaperone HemW [Bacteroidota bacterium]MDA1018942.1 radical SAM family heme chaperone HemW [Bacteroidota bacterium]
MAGIYIHIPYCKQACHYCNFHFSTSFKNKESVIESMLKEIQIKSIGYNELIETIYFGGGTPSFLEISEINKLIKTVFKNFKISLNPEITLEANPEDLNELKLKELSDSLVNRLSIGVQSFIDKDLKLMNRSHSSIDSKKCIENAIKYFDNISIDLIYGMPDSDLKSWEYNLDLALSWDLNHISAYALTVEPNTALYKYVTKEIIKPLEEELVFEQYNFMFNKMSNKQYVNYELSSFAKLGYFSKNNTAYWLRKKYIGIGPSAHSFDGTSRSWNVSNNSLYIKAIKENQMFLEKENLSEIDQYNEYIMTGLRTIWGVSLNYLKENFGINYRNHFKNNSQKFINSNHLILNEGIVKTTIKGKFLSDGIAAELFLINH